LDSLSRWGLEFGLPNNTLALAWSSSSLSTQFPQISGSCSSYIFSIILLPLSFFFFLLLLFFYFFISKLWDAAWILILPYLVHAVFIIHAWMSYKCNCHVYHSHVNLLSDTGIWELFSSTILSYIVYLCNGLRLTPNLGTPLMDIGTVLVQNTTPHERC